RRFSSGIYLDVVPVSGSPTAPRMDGQGAAIEYAVKMRQFAAGSLLSERAELGLLDHADIDGIASVISALHRIAPIARAGTEFGEPLSIRFWCEENFDHITPLLQKD